MRVLLADDDTLLGDGLHAGATLPVLTALDAVPKRIRGLDLGADDYVLKPVEPHELAARSRPAAGQQQRSMQGLRAKPLMSRHRLEALQSAVTLSST